MNGEKTYKPNSILFLDLEWNQQGKRVKATDEIVGVGITIYNEHGKEVIHKNIKPTKPILGKTKRLIHTNDRSISKGWSLDKMFKLLSEKVAVADIIVLWSEDSKVKLEMICNTYGVSYSSKVEVFQTVLASEEFFNRVMSFEDATLSYLPDTDPAQLHNAGYDSERLCELYFRVRDACEKTRNQSNIVRNIVDYDADGKKKATCKRIRALAGKKVSEDEMIDIASFYHISCKKKEGYYELMTKYSVWRMRMKDGYVISLKHENYKCAQGNGYHEQNISWRDVYGVIDYIARHDIDRYKQTKAQEGLRGINKNEKAKRMQKEKRRLQTIEKRDQDNWTNGIC